MCQSDTPDTNYIKRIIILLAGPLFSFVTISLFSMIIFNLDIHRAIKLYFFALIIMSTISLYASLKPVTINETLDSDGKQLLFVFKLKKKDADYVLALGDYNRGEFELAIDKFSIVAAAVPDNEKILRLLITSMSYTKNLLDTEKYLAQLEKYDELKVDELLRYGYIHSITGRSEQAIDIYKKTLKKDENNLTALTNLGYELALKNDYNAASEVSKKVIEIDENFAQAYSILGYLEIRNDNLELGKQLVERSLTMDPTYAYSYKHLAIYYLKMGEKAKAGFQLKKVAELDDFIDLRALLAELES